MKIKITSKTIDDETTLSVEDKKFYKFHLENLFIAYNSETSDAHKDVIFQEIINARKQFEENNRLRREYNAEETKKVQNHNDIISNKQMVTALLMMTTILGGGYLIKKYIGIKS